MLRMKSMGTSCEIVLRGILQNTFDEKLTLVQVKAWCREATSLYLIQCWPRSMSPCGVTKPKYQSPTIYIYIYALQGKEELWTMISNTESNLVQYQYVIKCHNIIGLIHNEFVHVCRSILGLFSLIVAEWRMQLSTNNAIVGLDNGLWPIRHPVIIWTKIGTLSIRQQGTYFNDYFCQWQSLYSRKCAWKYRLQNGGYLS